MYSVENSRQLLMLLQELYQQKVISRESKNDLALAIKRSFKTKTFIEVELLWKTIPCLRDEKQYLLDEIDIILGGK